jgi:hypothetical protein
MINPPQSLLNLRLAPGVSGICLWELVSIRFISLSVELFSSASFFVLFWMLPLASGVDFRVSWAV